MDSVLYSQASPKVRIRAFNTEPCYRGSLLDGRVTITRLFKGMEYINVEISSPQCRLCPPQLGFDVCLNLQ